MSTAGITEALGAIEDRAVDLLVARTDVWADTSGLDSPELRAVVRAVAQAMLERLETHAYADPGFLDITESGS